MRGCLAVVVGGIAFLAAVAWFALIPVADAIVSAGLLASGLSGTGTTVEVSASPPLELLTFHADGVRIRSSAVTWRGISAASLDLRLSDVDLGGRTAGSVTGRLDGVSIATSDGPVAVQRVDLAGASRAIRATLTLDPETASSLAAAAAGRAIGHVPSAVHLVAPDRVMILLGGQTAEGSISIVDGAIEANVPPFGRVTIVDPASEVPLAFDSVRVVADGSVALGALLEPVALGLSP